MARVRESLRVWPELRSQTRHRLARSRPRSAGRRHRASRRSGRVGCPAARGRGATRGDRCRGRGTGRSGPARRRPRSPSGASAAPPPGAGATAMPVAVMVARSNTAISPLLVITTNCSPPGRKMRSMTRPCPGGVAGPGLRRTGAGVEQMDGAVRLDSEDVTARRRSRRRPSTGDATARRRRSAPSSRCRRRAAAHPRRTRTGRRWRRSARRR